MEAGVFWADGRPSVFPPRWAGVWAAGLFGAALLAAGCQQPGTASGAGRGSVRQPSGAAPITNTDPCATRLHDMCGPLLLYYAAQRRLPDRLEELGQVPGFEQMRDFTCPVSGRPYVYDPSGIAGPDPAARVIIYDPLPSHSGLRWGVSVVVPGDGAPLVAKVIALPESGSPGRAQEKTRRG